MLSDFNYLAPRLKCNCGNTMCFPDGYYPSSIICSNCGATFSEKEIRSMINFPNRNLNKTTEELKQELREAIRKRDEVMKSCKS